MTAPSPWLPLSLPLSLFAGKYDHVYRRHNSHLYLSEDQSIGSAPIHTVLNTATGYLALHIPVLVDNLIGKLDLGIRYSGDYGWYLAAACQRICETKDSIELVTPSGSNLRYQWQQQQHAYIAPKDSTPCDAQIKKTAQGYVWYALETGIYLFFNQKGQLIRRKSALGHWITFNYEQNKLIRITDCRNNHYHFDWQNSSCQVSFQERTSDQSQLLVQYLFDAERKNQLIAMCFNHRHQPYDIHINYSSDHGCLIQQTDGSTLQFQQDEDSRCQSLGIGDNAQLLRCKYQDSNTTITLATQAKIKIQHNEEKEWENIALFDEEDTPKYYINCQWQDKLLYNISLNTGHTHRFNYDQYQRLTRYEHCYQDNELIYFKDRHFHHQGYIEKVEEGCSQQKLVTQYCYENVEEILRLKYEINVGGGVKQFNYDSNGIKEIIVFQLPYRGENSQIAIKQWAEQQNRYATRHQSVNQLGQITEAYQTLNLEHKKHQQQYWEYDYRGGFLTHRLADLPETIVVRDDALNRITQKTNAIGQTTLHRYCFQPDDPNIIEYPNGKTECHYHNAAGQCTKITSKSNNNFKEHYYFYDICGQLSCERNTAGQWYFYTSNTFGQQEIKLNAHGEFSQTTYWTDENISHQCDVAVAVNMQAIHVSQDVNEVARQWSSQKNIIIKQCQQQLNHSENRNRYHKTEPHMQVNLNAVGNLTIKYFTWMSHLYKQIQYATTLNKESIIQQLSDLSSLPKNKADRQETWVFNGLQKLLYRDSQSYVTLYQADALDNIIAQHQFPITVDDITWKSITSLKNYHKIYSVLKKICDEDDAWTFTDDQERDTTTLSSINSSYWQYNPINQLVVYINAESGKTTYGWNTVGKIEKKTQHIDNNNQVVTCFEYDALLRLSKQRDEHHGYIKIYQYDTCNNIIHQSIQTIDQPISSRDSYFSFDTDQRLLSYQSPLHNELNRIQQDNHQDQAVTVGELYIRDNSGLLWQYQHADGSKTTYSYDHSHRLIAQQSSRGILQLFVRNTFGNIIEQWLVKEPLATSWLHSFGSQTTIKQLRTAIQDKQVSCSIKKQHFDHEDRITEIIEDGGLRTTHYYNAFSDIYETQTTKHQSKPQGIIHQKVHDHRGLILQERWISLSRICIKEIIRTFNHSLGCCTSEKVDNGVTTYFTHDGCGRLVKRWQSWHDPITQQLKTIVYQQTSYDNISRITREVRLDKTITEYRYEGRDKHQFINKQWVTSQSYNPFGEIISQWNNRGIQQNTYFNAAGQPIRKDYQSDNLGQYDWSILQYDCREQLTYQQGPHSDITLAYDMDGNPNQTTQINTVLTQTHQRVISYDYDAHQFKSKETHHGMGYHEYDYDSQGNIISDKSQDTKNHQSRICKRTFNHLHQYLSQSYGDISSEEQYSVENTYDGIGNKTSQIIDPAGLSITSSQHYDRKKRVHYQTDAEGNQKTTCYDESGQARIHIDENNYVTYKSYNNNRQLCLIFTFSRPYTVHNQQIALQSERPYLAVWQDMQSLKNDSDIITAITWVKDNLPKSIYKAYIDPETNRWNIQLKTHFYSAIDQRIYSQYQSFDIDKLSDSDVMSILLQVESHNLKPNCHHEEFYCYNEFNQLIIHIDHQGIVIRKIYNADKQLQSRHLFHRRIDLKQKQKLTQQIYDHQYTEFDFLNILGDDYQLSSAEQERDDYLHWPNQKPLCHIDPKGLVTLFFHDQDWHCVEQRRCSVPLAWQDRISIKTLHHRLSEDYLDTNITSTDRIKRNYFNYWGEIIQQVTENGGCELYQRNALGCVTEHTNRANGKTIFRYDSAKRLVMELQTGSGCHQIDLKDKHPSIKQIADTTGNRYQYHDNHHPSLSYALHSEVDTAKRENFDARGQIAETSLITTCDDPNKIPSRIDDFPIRTVTIQKHYYYNHSKKLIAQKNPQGQYRYYGYHPLGMLLFDIHEDGVAIRHTYDIQGHLLQTRHYSCYIHQDMSGYIAGDLSITTILQWLRALESDSDQITHFNYHPQYHTLTEKQSSAQWYYDANTELFEHYSAAQHQILDHLHRPLVQQHAIDSKRYNINYYWYQPGFTRATAQAQSVYLTADQEEPQFLITAYEYNHYNELIALKRYFHTIILDGYLPWTIVAKKLQQDTNDHVEYYRYTILGQLEKRIHYQRPYHRCENSQLILTRQDAITSYQYHPLGKQSIVKRPDGHRFLRFFDQHGRLKSQLDWAVPQQSGSETQLVHPLRHYFYDPQGFVIATLDDPIGIMAGTNINQTPSIAARTHVTTFFYRDPRGLLIYKQCGDYQVGYGYDCLQRATRQWHSRSCSLEGTQYYIDETRWCYLTHLTAWSEQKVYRNGQYQPQLSMIRSIDPFGRVTSQWNANQPNTKQRWQYQAYQPWLKLSQDGIYQLTFYNRDGKISLSVESADTDLSQFTEIEQAIAELQVVPRQRTYLRTEIITNSQAKVLRHFLPTSVDLSPIITQKLITIANIDPTLSPLALRWTMTVPAQDFAVYFRSNQGLSLTAINPDKQDCVVPLSTLEECQDGIDVFYVHRRHLQGNRIIEGCQAAFAMHLQGPFTFPAWHILDNHQYQLFDIGFHIYLAPWGDNCTIIALASDNIANKLKNARLQVSLDWHEGKRKPVLVTFTFDHKLQDNWATRGTWPEALKTNQASCDINLLLADGHQLPLFNNVRLKGDSRDPHSWMVAKQTFNWLTPQGPYLDNHHLFQANYQSVTAKPITQRQRIIGWLLFTHQLPVLISQPPRYYMPTESLPNVWPLTVLPPRTNRMETLRYDSNANLLEKHDCQERNTYYSYIAGTHFSLKRQSANIGWVADERSKSIHYRQQHYTPLYRQGIDLLGRVFAYQAGFETEDGHQHWQPLTTHQLTANGCIHSTNHGDICQFRQYFTGLSLPSAFEIKQQVWLCHYQDNHLVALVSTKHHHLSYRFTYDGSTDQPNSLQVGDYSGALLRWCHNSLGHISQLQLPEGQKEQFATNRDGAVVQHRTALGWVKYQRDANTQHKLQQSDNGGAVTEYHYNYRGQLTAVIANQWGDRAVKKLNQQRVLAKHPQDANVTIARITALPLTHQYYVYHLDWLTCSYDTHLNSRIEMDHNPYGDLMIVQRFQGKILTHKTQIKRDALGTVYAEVIGDTNPGYVTRQLAWDPYQRLVMQQLTFHSDDAKTYMQSLAYAYDDAQKLTYHGCAVRWVDPSEFELQPPSVIQGGHRQYNTDKQLISETLKDKQLHYQILDGVRISAIDDGEAQSFRYDAIGQITSISNGGHERFHYQFDKNGIQRIYLNRLQSLQDKTTQLTDDGLAVAATESTDSHFRGHPIKQCFSHRYAIEDGKSLMADWAGQAEDLIQHHKGKTKTSYLCWRGNQISTVVIGDNGDRQQPRVCHQMRITVWADHNHMRRIHVIDGPLAMIEGMSGKTSLPFNMVLTYHLFLDHRGDVIASVTTTPISPSQWGTAPSGERSVQEPKYLGGKYHDEWLIGPAQTSQDHLGEIYGYPLANRIAAEQQRLSLNALPNQSHKDYLPCIHLSDPINTLTLRQATLQPLQWYTLEKPTPVSSLDDSGIEAALLHTLKQVFANRPLPAGFRLPMTIKPCEAITPDTAFPQPIPVREALTIAAPPLSTTDNLVIDDDHDMLLETFIDNFISAVIAVFAPLGLGLVSQFRQTLWVGIRTATLELAVKHVAHQAKLLPKQSWQDAIQQGLHQAMGHGLPLLWHLQKLRHLPPLFQHISQSLLTNISMQSVKIGLNQQHGWHTDQMLKAVTHSIEQFTLGQIPHLLPPATAHNSIVEQLATKALYTFIKGRSSHLAIELAAEIGQFSGNIAANSLVQHYQDSHAANDHNYHQALMASQGLDPHYAGEPWFDQLDLWLEQTLALGEESDAKTLPQSSDITAEGNQDSSNTLSSQMSRHGLFSTTAHHFTSSKYSPTQQVTQPHHGFHWSTVVDLSHRAGHFAYLAIHKSAHLAFELSPLGTTLNSYSGLRYGHTFLDNHPMSSWAITENIAGSIAWSVPAIAIARRSWKMVSLGEQLTLSSLFQRHLLSTPVAKRYMEQSVLSALASAYGATAAGGTFEDIRQATELGALNGLVFATPAFQASRLLSNIYFQSAATSLVGQAVAKFHHPEAHWSPLGVGFSMIGAGAAEYLTREINVEFYKMMATAKITVPIETVGSHFASDHQM